MCAEASWAVVWWSAAGGALLGWSDQLPGGGDRSGEGAEAVKVGGVSQ